MSGQAIITTICGAFLFPFVIRLMWGKFVEVAGAVGGFIAAFVIVGTMWLLNHGINNHLIVQSGVVWIDMAWPAAIGIFTASVVTGGKVGKSFVNIGAALVGGVLGGIILTFLV